MILSGRFYEFHRERVVSRPGAVLVTRPGIEIGPEISRELALKRVRGGKDVYTFAKEDDRQLAERVLHGQTLDEWTHTHRPDAKRTSRDDIFYRHFHPGGIHPNAERGPGHIYYGERGEGFRNRG